MMKLHLWFRRFSAFIIGIVFVLSGIFKLLDPVGTGLIIKDYYLFFHLDFLDFTAKHIGWLLAFIETVLGLALMAGIWRKHIAKSTLFFIVFFTCLTAIFLIYNPSMDCGCFGEALHLTHLQTFLKNLILLGISIISFVPFTHLNRPNKRKIYIFFLATVLVFAFGIYSWRYLPVIDFTPYKTSTKLFKPDTESSLNESDFQANFIYEKDGIQKTFSLDNLPDSTWTYIDTQVISNIKETTNSLANLNIYSKEGKIKDELIHRKNVMIISIYNENSLNLKDWDNISEYIKDLKTIGYNPLILTAAINYGDLINMLSKLGLNLENLSLIEEHLYTSDYKTLITLNRSNSGLSYISNSYILSKWSRHSKPSFGKLEKIIKDHPVETYLEGSSRGTIFFKIYILLIFLLMLI